MIRGLSRIVPNVVGGVCLAMGFLIAQPATAEEKAKAAAPAGEPTVASSSVSAPLVKGTLPADDPNAAVWSSAPPATFPDVASSPLADPYSGSDGQRYDRAWLARWDQRGDSLGVRRSDGRS